MENTQGFYKDLNEEEAEKMGINTHISFAEEGELDEPISFGEDPNEKKYLIFFIYADDEGDMVKDWEMITGRENLYNFVKGHAETMDLKNSKILSGNLTVDEAVDVYTVIRSFKEQGMFVDDFDIEDYV